VVENILTSIIDSAGVVSEIGILSPTKLPAAKEKNFHSNQNENFAAN
jgi:hypothetical protein